MNFSNTDISKALATVHDPDLHNDLVSLNMIKDITTNIDGVSFTVVLTTPACPLKEKIKQDCLNAVRKVVGNETKIDITMSSSVTSTRNNTTTLTGVKNIISIASGKGGVGKSTITANMAISLAQKGAKVGLIDADIYGPSVPIMFNCEHEQPEIKTIKGKKTIIPLERYGVKLISIGLLTPVDSAIVWRGPMASSALKQFIYDACWGDLDYLFIDLPPGTGDIHLTLVQTLPVTGAVIVTTPQKVALADAIKSFSMFKQPRINVPILGVVENMAYFTPEELPNNKYFIFGKGGGEYLSKKYTVPLLGQIPLAQNIQESGDSGLPTVLKGGSTAKAFTDLTESLARQVAIRNATLEQTKKVEVVKE